MDDGILTSEAGTDGQRILTINSMISSWRGAKQRIELVLFVIVVCLLLLFVCYCK